MSTPSDKQYTKMLETLVDYNECNNAPLSNKKLWQETRKVIAETESEERNIILDYHNITMDNFCQYPGTTNTQGKNANTILTSERLNNLDALVETLKWLTINDTRYYNSDENDT